MEGTKGGVTVGIRECSGFYILQAHITGKQIK